MFTAKHVIDIRKMIHWTMFCVLAQESEFHPLPISENLGAEIKRLTLNSVSSNTKKNQTQVDNIGYMCDIIRIFLPPHVSHIGYATSMFSLFYDYIMNISH